MFWADTISPNASPRQVVVPTKYPSMVIVEKASLYPQTTSGDTDLFVTSLNNPEKYGSKGVFICTLNSSTPSIDLQLKFSKSDEAAFFVRGPGTVYLTGYSTLKNYSYGRCHGSH